MVIHEAAKKLINSETPLLDARVLLSYVTGENAALLFRELTDEEKNRFDVLLQRRASGEPIAYIIGEKEFMGQRFLVDKSCLIPRPDTETVVEYLIDRFGSSKPKILDLCCGSGCIGLSLAIFIKSAYIMLGDISDGALNITRKNIALHGLEERAKAYKTNVLEDSFPRGFDLIVSNPPYIPSSVTDGLEVTKSEPRLALDGGNDGLDFYRAITPKAYDALNKGGALAYEIGYDQGEAVNELLKSSGFKNVVVKKDYGGNYRLVYGEKQ